MAKSGLRLKARELREKGESIKSIAKELQVARSSVSVWVRDIILTRGQIERLLQREVVGAEIGRLRSAEVRKEKRKNYIAQQMKEGEKVIDSLTQRDLLIAGIALYWGEGSKRNGSIQFCNSDLKMIQFFILWLEKCFSIRRDELTCWVGINEIHEERIEAVREYWSLNTGILLSQFKGTSFKRVTNKKIYENFEEHFGTLFIRVDKPYRLYYKLLGMIEALGKSANVAQRLEQSFHKRQVTGSNPVVGTSIKEQGRGEGE